MQRGNRHILDIALAAILSVYLAAPGALAAGGGDKKADEQKETATSEAVPQEVVPENSTVMPVLVAPVVIGGRRSHYIYISYRLVAHKAGQIRRIETKIPYLHDAFLRDVYRQNVVRIDNPNLLDQEEINRRFKKVVADVMHEDSLKEVHLIRMDKEHGHADF